MKRTVKVIALSLMAVVALAVAGADAGETAGLYGNAAAKADESLTIEDMLLYAAQDEYLARGEYVAIMKKFGTIRPFSNIMKAEENHLAWLKDAYAAYDLSFPADDSSAHLHIPASLLEAYKTGVQAEIDNIAMYDRFLATDLIQSAENKDLKVLFTNLRNGSENHLRAFQNQLLKY
ncbi:MAG: DUF2202 domain-containing protein [Spirochaetia bacterium]|jgi:hypothetical protein|nr:DUF2202 domain-containing protein [Spirochaetia bacterium]